MLKTQVVQNTWKCDGVNCPTPEETVDGDPYFVVRVHKPSVDSASPLQIDLCNVCIDTITAESIVAYVAPLKS